MDVKAVGKYIQYLRKSKNLSQKALAEQLSISYQAISKWETGENLPDASFLLDLAHILGTTTDMLLSAGHINLHSQKFISMHEISLQIEVMKQLYDHTGSESPLWLEIDHSLSAKLGFPFTQHLNDAFSQMLLTELPILHILNGYSMSPRDIDHAIHSASLRHKIHNALSSCRLFSTKSEQYQDFRPSYPLALIEMIFTNTESPIVVELGSGTGKLTQLYTEYAKKIYAIEPNSEMRLAAEKQLSHFPNHTSVSASAENTHLPDHCADVIIAAESYHWFDNDVARAEIRRILKPNGHVFLVWNEFGGNEYDSKMTKISDHYRKQKKLDRSGITHEQRAIRLFGENHYQSASFDNSCLQTKEQFCGGWASAAFVPDKDTPEYQDFIKQAENLFDQYAHNGLLQTSITTTCYFGIL